MKIEKNKIKILCITCSFGHNLENNPNIMVMSIMPKKFISTCSDCEKKVGHSKKLDELRGIYHLARHKTNKKITESFGKSLSLGDKFYRLSKNKLNGDSLNCFIEVIRCQRYSDKYLKEWFSKLLEGKDYELFNKKELIEELIYISNQKKVDL